jgi:hypothetical protein
LALTATSRVQIAGEAVLGPGAPIVLLGRGVVDARGPVRGGAPGHRRRAPPRHALADEDDRVRVGEMAGDAIRNA